MKLPACLLTLLAAVAAGQEPEVSFLSVDNGVEGDGSLEIAWTADGSALLVVNRVSGNVTFLDPATQTVTDAVPVGREPLDVELTPSGQYALVPCSLDDDLAILDVAARAVVAKVPLTGTFPYQVEVDSVGAHAVVACATGSVSVVDVAARVETSSFPTIVQYGDQSDGYSEDPYRNRLPSYPRMDLGADDRTLVLPNGSLLPPAIAVYDVLTAAKLGEVAGFSLPVAAVLDPTMSYAVFADALMYGGAYVVDLQTWQATYFDTCVWTCYTPPQPEGLVLSPTGTEAVLAGHSLGFLDIAGAQDLGGLGYAGAFTADGSAGGAHVFAVGNDLMVVDAATRQEVARLEGVMGNRIAAHPTLDRIAVLNSVTDERVHWFDFNGASLLELGSTRTGPSDEGDGPVFTACDATGAVLMTANFLSDGVTVFETGSGASRWIDTGDRPFACALDAKGEVGAVLHRTGELAVVDPLSGAMEARLPIGPGPVALAVTPDGSEAIVLDDADDTVTFVALAGAASQVVATLSMGADVSPPDRRALLSSKGVLAVPLEGSNELALVDVSSHAAVKVMKFAGPVDDVAFSRDGRYAYASMRSQNRVWQVFVDGSNSQKLGMGKVQDPRLLWVSNDGEYLYVVSSGATQKLRVLETAGMTQVAALELSGFVWDLVGAGPNVFVHETYGLRWFHAAGAATSELAYLPLGGRAVDVLPAPDGALYAAEPDRDGLEAFRFTGDSTNYCGPATLNSTGQSATIAAGGWNAAGGLVTLSARDMPPGEAGYFLTSTDAGFVPFAGGSQGHLCLGGSIGRFLDQARLVDAAGTFWVVVDTAAMPQPGGTVAVQPGETWRFQAWFRDHNPGPTSNFTDGLEVTFE